MKKSLLILLVTMLCTSPAWSYDQELAASYQAYFQSIAGKATPKALQMIPTKAFVEAVKKGEKLFVIDIRTPAETGLIGMTLPGSIAIPMNQLFKPENLARIPTDQKVVIVCKGGHRSMAVATGLRHIGFKKVFVLKLGTADLAKYLSPKTAY